MRLIDVEINNFRRFRGRNKVNVDGKLVAFIGPNEAGKSSLLEALSSMSNQDGFDRWQLTKGEDVKPEDTVVRLRFLLDSSDAAALSHLPPDRIPRWYVWSKTADGQRFHDVEPSIKRDISSRTALSALLGQIESTKWFRQLLVDAAEDASLDTAVADVREILDSGEENFEAADLAALQAFVVRWIELIRGTNKPPKRALQIPAKVESLLNLERKEHPRSIALKVLAERRPQMSLFGERSRDLKSAYDLAEVADTPSIALWNLANLADLNLVYLRDVAQADDPAEKEAVIERANDRLRDVFSSAWSQAPVTVKLTADATTLNILVPRVGGGYSIIAERSDGLRAFVALVCHAALETDKPPILLIDEAERHLHYDAQADLIRMLVRQTTASQVIYTTHSAGCLPEDIGGSVRVVNQIEGEAYSVFKNNIWTSGPGFSPLFVAMGASALAFSAARRAVIAEGISDVILLPALLRSASQTEELGFQVAPGLAEINRRSASQLDFEGGKVLYVLDSDESGKAIARDLAASGAPKTTILHIGPNGSVIEDAIHPNLYAFAVTEETRRSGALLKLQASDLPAQNRPGYIAHLCDQSSIPVPKKRHVAQLVLEQRTEYPSIHDPRWTDRLVTLRRRLRDLLGCDTE